MAASTGIRCGETDEGPGTRAAPELAESVELEDGGLLDDASFKALFLPP